MLFAVEKLVHVRLLGFRVNERRIRARFVRSKILSALTRVDGVYKKEQCFERVNHSKAQC